MMQAFRNAAKPVVLLITVTFLIWMVVDLSGITIRRNGFSIANGSFTLTSVNLGGFLAVQSPALTLTDFNLTYGGGPTTVTGTIGLTMASGTLTIGSFLSASITDGADADAHAIVGTFDIATKSVTLAADKLSFSIPDLLTATGSGVTITYVQGGAADQTLLTADNLTATLIPLNNATLTINGLVVRKNGFSIANGSATMGDLQLASLLTITAPRLEFEAIDYTIGGALSGKLTLGATSVSAALGDALTLNFTDSPLEIGRAHV